MEPVIELSRPGCESLEFKVSEISPQTVGNAFRVSYSSLGRAKKLRIGLSLFFYS